MSLIEVSGLKKSFGPLEVLKGIDLNVEEGLGVTILKKMAKRQEYRREGKRNVIHIEM